MIKTSLLLALLIAIKYAESNTVPTAAEPIVQPTVISADSAQTSNLVPTTVDLSNSATTNLMGSMNDISYDKLVPKKKKPYYPVDLIGKKKGCISHEHIQTKCGKIHHWTEPSQKMTIQACLRQCLGHRASYAILFKGHQCLCTSTMIGKDAPKGTSDTPCQGNNLQKCGSQTCGDFYVLKINSDTLRHSIRNLEEKNTWVHKKGQTEWVRYVDGKPDFSLVERFAASSAIYAYRDCTREPRPNCQNFNVVLNGFEDGIINSNDVTPIDVEWDIVFAKEKSSHGEADVLLLRRSLCQWVLKENEIVTREFLFVSFDERARTLTLVDKKDTTITVKVNDYTYTESAGGVVKTTFEGKWFNKIHHFKDYFKGADACAYQMP